MYESLRPCNPKVPGASGQCLKYVRQTFAIASLWTWAWTAWLKAKYKHRDRNLPNVPCAVWFSYRVVQGHVVTYVPKQGFYSVTKYGVRRFKTIEEVENFIGCKFVGWTEDINGVRVCQPKPAPKPVKLYYIVKKGDTLSKIARANKTTVAKLVSLNKIKNPDLIFPGQKVRVK